jgi:hypothetical protein
MAGRFDLPQPLVLVPGEDGLLRRTAASKALKPTEAQSHILAANTENAMEVSAAIKGSGRQRRRS